MGRGQGINYGLFFKEELVAILQIKLKNEDIYEISRFASKLDTTVVGGFSRLLSFFEKTVKPNKLINFVDLRYGGGAFLVKLGFIREKSYISFKWCKNHKTFHRMKFPSNSGYEHGYAKIWDCGQAKFVKTYQIFEKGV